MWMSRYIEDENAELLVTKEVKFRYWGVLNCADSLCIKISPIFCTANANLNPTGPSTPQYRNYPDQGLGTVLMHKVNGMFQERKNSRKRKKNRSCRRSIQIMTVSAALQTSNASVKTSTITPLRI